MAISTPNMDSLQAKVSNRQWFHLDPPRHLCLFSLQTLEGIMRSLRFRLLKVHHFSMEKNPYGWLQSLLNRLSHPDNRLYDLLKNNPALGRQRLSCLERGKMLFWLLAYRRSAFYFRWPRLCSDVEIVLKPISGWKMHRGSIKDPLDL